MKPDASASRLSPELVACAESWARRRAAGLTAAEATELKTWLAADAGHRAAFRKAEATPDEFDWALHAGVTDEVLAGLAQRATRRRRSRRRTVAAGLAVALFAAVFWVIPARQTAPVGPGFTPVAVLAPERRMLPDGTVVELKEGAVLSVAFTPEFRRVELERGEAHFTVTKNAARPFVVVAGAVDVRAVGTAFSVQRGGPVVEVLVTEGRVAVEKPAEISTPDAPGTSRILATLEAGHRTVVDTSSTLPVEAAVENLTLAESDERLAWRAVRLDFSSTPLAQAVEMINRHNAVQLVIADERLAALELGGMVRADKIDAVVDTLEHLFPLRAERRGERIFLHAR